MVAPTRCLYVEVFTSKRIMLGAAFAPKVILDTLDNLLTELPRVTSNNEVSPGSLEARVVLNPLTLPKSAAFFPRSSGRGSGLRGSQPVILLVALSFIATVAALPPVLLAFAPLCVKVRNRRSTA